jgi:DNA-binding HxlR family transcriptional regulator
MSEHPGYSLEVWRSLGQSEPSQSVSKGYYLRRVGAQKILGLNQKAKRPRLTYQADPIRDSLKVLGAKWSLLILRDVAFLRLHRFGDIRRNNPGLTARVLSRKLRQMVNEGLLDRLQEGREVRYSLTAKGEDAVYILLAVLRYGIRHHMSKSASFDEEEAMRELHYQVGTEQR